MIVIDVIELLMGFIWGVVHFFIRAGQALLWLLEVLWWFDWPFAKSDEKDKDKVPRDPLTPEAERALAEAEERRRQPGPE